MDLKTFSETIFNNKNIVKCSNKYISSNTGINIVTIFTEINNKEELLKIKLPKLLAMKGIGVYENSRYLIDLFFDNNDKEIEETKLIFNVFDVLIKNIASQHPEWFDKETISLEEITTMFKPTIRKTKEDYDSIRTKIFCNKNNELQLTCYDQNNKECKDIKNHIKENSLIQATLQCNGLWFYENNFGLTWRIIECISEPCVSKFNENKCYISEQNE